MEGGGGGVRDGRPADELAPEDHVAKLFFCNGGGGRNFCHIQAIHARAPGGAVSCKQSS